jgi:hypothetical protein
VDIRYLLGGEFGTVIMVEDMRAARKTAAEIARKLKRTPGAVYARPGSISMHRTIADAQ